MSSPSPVRMTPALQAKIAACNSASEIAKIVQDEAVLQGVAQRSEERGNEFMLVEVPESERPPVMLQKSFTVDGQKYTVEGADEISLARAEAAAYRGIFAPPVEQPRDEAGRFVSSLPPISAEESARISELRIQVAQGLLSPDEFAVRSGIADRVFAEREERRAFREQNQVRDSWTSATTEFKSNHPDWKGGSDLTNRVGDKLIELELADNPSAESLESAWAAIQAEDAEASATDAITNAQSPDQILEALGRNKYSGMFGR